MKTKSLIVALAFLAGQAATAKNTTTSVEKVTTAVTLSDDVDYVITTSDPFSVTGSIDITNTDHATIIMSKILPSVALSYLTYITINGETAENDVNCQVKRYGSGSIIMPYSSDIKPLTVYSEQYFQGDSVNDFGTENSGGYMNSLTTSKLNNNIRSFKLKRGYMVTFSNSGGGRGYSRCFIADDEDLEFSTLPDAMDKRISSYRIFKWIDGEKKGLANNTSQSYTQLINAAWCYSFGLGEYVDIDCECVPHHIYEDWPSTAECGAVTYSAHMKTNNEPGNSSDDTPQDVATVLANWQNLMRTGMRLLSPSSHDGSLSWMAEFMDSIDSKGWRCDIVDMHCYWPEWNLKNMLATYYNSYNRPIWVSEFVWGASWNNNGIFGYGDDTASTAQQQRNYDVMSSVLTQWNSTAYIERYAYWNTEAACSKVILSDGSLTLLGEFYAEMESGIAYNSSYEFVPLVVQTAPSDLAVTYTEKTKLMTATWTNDNMEFTDSTYLEYSVDGGDWKVFQSYTSSEKSSYTFTYTFDENSESGMYTIRVRNFDMDGNERLSNEVYLSLVAAEGNAGFQYGRLTITDTESFNTSFTACDETPLVFAGLISYNNTTTVPVNTVMSVSSSKFSFHVIPWSCGDFDTEISSEETTDFMVLSEGTRQIGDITMEVGTSSSRIRGDSTRITFATPFEEGVTPVVIANVITSYVAYPIMVKVWNITNEGFDVKLTRQAELSESYSTFTSQYINYVAATPGTAKMDDGKILTVGRGTNLVDGRTARIVYFSDDDDFEGLYNPYILCGPQTSNYSPAAVYRITKQFESNSVNYLGETGITALRFIRQKDTTDDTTESDNRTYNGDVMGWIIVSSDSVETETGVASYVKQDAPLSITVYDRQIIVDGTDDYEIFAVSGMQLSRNARLGRGIYIVKVGKQTSKVFVP